MNVGLDYFLPYQRAWIDDPTPVSIGEKSRRIGWTYASSYRAVERRVRGLGSLYFASVDRTASREFIDYCKKWAHVFNAVAVESEAEEVIEDRKITMQLLTFGNGHKIVAGSSNPNFFRSKGGDADGDEFAFHRDGRELLKAMHATALFWGGQLRLWSTHNGPGSYFNTILQQIRGGKMKGRIHRVTILDAVEQGIVEKIKQLKHRDEKARQEWLDELRGSCPDDDVWNEEYLCVPSTDQGSLLNYELIRACEAENLVVCRTAGELVEWLKGHPAAAVYLGGDIGRKHDRTVIWADERIGDVLWTRGVVVLEKTPYSVQEDAFAAILGSPAVKRCCIDSTGIGAMLAERLGDRFGRYRVEAVQFTGPVKAELAMPMLRCFQDRLKRIPGETEIREDLHKVRRVVTAAGNIRFEADRDEAGHADRFWAAALAVHAADVTHGPRKKALAEMPVGW